MTNNKVQGVRNGARLLKRLAYYITIMGWVILAVYIFAINEVQEDGSASELIVKDFISLESNGIRFRALVFFAPFITSLVGYFVFQISRLYEKSDETEHKLANALDEWRLTFDNMPNGVMLVDNEHRITRTNRWISQQLGRPIKETIGATCTEVAQGLPLPSDLWAVGEEPQPGQTIRREFTDVASERYFLCEVTPIVLNRGQVYLYTLIDITDLKSVLNGLIFAFADALDAKSPWTRGHSERVTYFALSIGMEMGLGEKDMEDLRIAAMLHDIGKIGTYDVILDKPGKLTPEEFALVKLHPATGAGLLKHIKHFEHIIPAIRHHHERLDGMGYPDGLKGMDIPLLARILCIADSYDAITAERPYKLALGKDKAILELEKGAGKQFDPELVEVFLRILGNEPQAFS